MKRRALLGAVLGLPLFGWMFRGVKEESDDNSVEGDWDCDSSIRRALTEKVERDVGNIIRDGNLCNNYFPEAWRVDTWWGPQHNEDSATTTSSPIIKVEGWTEKSISVFSYKPNIERLMESMKHPYFIQDNNNVEKSVVCTQFLTTLLMARRET